jgi:hypothetical protein
MTPCRSVLERNLIIQIATLRRIPRRTTRPAPSRPGCRPGRTRWCALTRGVTTAAARPALGPTAVAAAFTARARIQHRKLPVEPADHHLGGIAFLALLIGPLVHYAAGRRRGEPISTAFVESAVNEIIAKRMNKKQQRRWNRTTVQSFLDVRTAVLNDNLKDAFRHRYPGFRPSDDDQVPSEAA